jgi:hypothetical protein
MMQCPVCRQPLVALEFQSVETDFCPRCHGVWLDHGEIGLLLKSRPDFMPAWKTPAARTGDRPCPHCTRKMQVRSLAGDVEVDACPRDHGIWLDKGELQAIIQSAANTQDVAALSKYCDEVFGKGVHT